MNHLTVPRRHALTGVALLALAACSTPPAAPDAQAVVREALAAMGGTDLKTLRFAGSGTGSTFGQAWQPDLTWPALNYSSFTRVVDYENRALREEFARSRAEPNGGGAVPLMGGGEQRATGLLHGDFAWNLAGTTATAAPVALDGRIHDLWTTPHGVLKAAARNDPSVSIRREGGRTWTAVRFTEAGRFIATAVLGPDRLVERIESRLPNPVLGDVDVVTQFSDYRDHGGVKFPSRIRQTQAGFPVLDLTVSEVQPNAPADIQAPEAVRNFGERVVAEKAAEGVWHLAGGSHNSVLIEMRDHVILVESPLYDGRAAAVIAEVARLAPGKPIRYVINTHHHFDHAGGLRAAIADGATLVCAAMAKPFYERAFSTPNGVQPDLLARSGRRATAIGVSGRHVLGDGIRSVEIHEIQDSVHARGFLMVYLPAEKLLVEADAYTPAAPGTSPPNPANLNHQNLVGNIERLNLVVERILPLHGRIVPLAELHTAVGR